MRHGYVLRCSQAALALYLVLVSVADAEGLSYYSNASLERMLRLEPAALSAARSELIGAGLLAYEKPLYQVLALEDPAPGAGPAPRSGQVRSLKEVFAQVLEKGGAS